MEDPFDGGDRWAAHRAQLEEKLVRGGEFTDEDRRVLLEVLRWTESTRPLLAATHVLAASWVRGAEIVNSATDSRDRQRRLREAAEEMDWLPPKTGGRQKGASVAYEVLAFRFMEATADLDEDAPQSHWTRRLQKVRDGVRPLSLSFSTFVRGLEEYRAALAREIKHLETTVNPAGLDAKRRVLRALHHLPQR